MSLVAAPATLNTSVLSRVFEMSRVIHRLLGFDEEDITTLRNTSCPKILQAYSALKGRRRKITFENLKKKDRRYLWIGHTVGHNEFVVNILEGAIFGKNAVGRPGLQYLKQVARNTAADSYTAMEKWLATVADGKLPTDQKIEGKEKEC